MSEIVGVILAAGRGQRMGVLGEYYPKALLPIANLPIIYHQLRLLRSLGVREVFVVVGHRATDLAAALGDGKTEQLKIHYVEQGEPKGSAHALARLRPFIHQPFLLLLGDYYFETSDPGRLVGRLMGDSCAAISAKREPETRLIAEACALQIDTDGRVLDIIEKPKKPVTNIKGCGFYALPPEFLDAVARTPRTALRDEYEITVSLELYIKAGYPLYAEEIIDWDTNLTNPENLLECNLKWLAERDKSELVAEDTLVDVNIDLSHCVIGSNVIIKNVPSVEESVFFPGSQVVGGGAIRRALVTPRNIVLCP